MSRKITGVYKEKVAGLKFPDHQWAMKGRLADAIKASKEKHNLSTLDEHFIALIKGKSVIDFGGAAGLDYFKLNQPEVKKWRVVEIEPCVSHYKEFVESVDKMEISEDMTQGFEVFYSRGTLQYIGDMLLFLKESIKEYDVVYLKDLIVGSSNFYTIQEGIGLSEVIRIEDLEELFDEFNIIKETGRDKPYYDVDIGEEEIHNHVNLLAVRCE